MRQAQINVRTRACSRTSIARTKQAALTHNVRGKELNRTKIKFISKKKNYLLAHYIVTFRNSRSLIMTHKKPSCASHVVTFRYKQVNFFVIEISTRAARSANQKHH